MNNDDKYKLLTSHLQHDGGLFWARSHYFMLANSILLGFAVNHTINMKSGCANESIFSIILCFIGVVLLIAWWLAIMTGKFWIHHWQFSAKKLEEELFEKDERLLTFTPDPTSPRYIPATWLPYILIGSFGVAWIAISYRVAVKIFA